MKSMPALHVEIADGSAPPQPHRPRPVAPPLLPTAPPARSRSATDAHRTDSTLHVVEVADDVEPMISGFHGRSGPVIRPAVRGVRLTDRDREFLWFLVRFRFCTITQAAQYLGVTTAVVRNSIVARLRPNGYISVHSARRAGIPGNVLSIAKRGADAIGLGAQDVPKTPPNDHLAHTLGITDIGLDYLTAGENVVTEWEIRIAAQGRRFTHGMQQGTQGLPQPTGIWATLTPPAQGLFVTIPSSRSGRRSKYPDLVLARGFTGSIPLNVAIEFERSKKKSGEYSKIAKSYRYDGNGQFASVLFLIPNGHAGDQIGRLYATAISAIHAQSLFQITRYDPPSLPLPVDY